MKQYPFDPVPASEIRSRIDRAKNLLESQGVEGLFLTHKPDIYYFSGTAQDCYLFIPADREPVLFVKRYLPRVLKETCLKHIEPVESIKQIVQLIANHCSKLPKSCAMAYDVVPVKDFFFYQKLFDPCEMTDGTAIIASCRQIKSDWEIRQLEKAADVSQKTFDYMAQHIAPEISEMEFCGMFECFSRTLGHSGKLLTRHYRLEGFPFHLMSGRNGGLPGALDSPLSGTGTSNAYPYGAGPKPLEKNEPILIDFGVFLDGYHIDESRMFVMGKMPQKAWDASMASIEILDRLKDIMQPGIPMGSLFDEAVKMAKKMKLEEEFLGLPEIKSKFIGHGIGLELVEEPVLAKGRDQKLLPGMVFAVEPKFIFKDSFAAGIESVIHVTEKGGRYLSRTENKIFVC